MANRKDDHIELAFESNTPVSMADPRFDYNPIHGVHPEEGQTWQVRWGKYDFDYPVWVSSMTGGAIRAKTINQNLARLCKDYSLGMGLGSCRKLIDNRDSIADFQVRKYISTQPLYANLGIAQCQQWLKDGKESYIREIMSITESDGLIVHINPMQEWMQAEGDRIKESPLNTIKRMLDSFDFPIIVKEVGQGMSYTALKALSQLSVEAIEFGAFGGTNFALLEMLRDKEQERNVFEPFCKIGHTAEQMVQSMNQILSEKESLQCSQIIISGGIKSFLDAYYYLSMSNVNSIYGMASALLAPAMESYESLQKYFTLQMQGLLLSKSYLTVRK
ncbi:MAG: type 2 isopentenyl-diphosphate Delta-isomerase [Saprospiraceae bacterium]|nr:type 2 isopentenyl-diphosphate Delta-isomerase [Saprospiraceae bacterium]